MSKIANIYLPIL